MSIFPPDTKVLVSRPGNSPKERHTGRQTIRAVLGISPFLIVLLLAGSGCSKASTTTANVPASGPKKGPPSLTATPNPVPAGTDKGKTTITWSTGDGSVGQVYVLNSGKPERLFATGSKGSKEAPWIQNEISYEFRLYAGNEHTQLLATITVVRSK